MAYRYSSSSDSKYFLVFDEENISCLLGEKSIWRTEFKEGKISFATVSTFGSVLIETHEGELFIIKQGSDGIIEKLEVPSSNKLKKSILCKYFHMTENGKNLFYMRKTIKSGNNFFALSKEGSCEFELMMLEFQTLKPKVCYKYSIPESLESSFLWNISTDGSYYIFACPKKQTGKLSIEVRLMEMEFSKILRTLRLTDTQITEMVVHRSGVSLLKLVQGNAESFSVMSREGDIFSLAYDKGKSFFYLARGFVLFEYKTGRSHIFTAQSFNGQHLATYNMDTFVDKAVDFALLFNARDLLSLVYMFEGKFYTFSAELLTLTTEIKRFEIIASKKTKQINHNNDDYNYYDYYGYDDKDSQTTSSAMAKEAKVLSEVQIVESKLPEKFESIPVTKDIEMSQKSETIKSNKNSKPVKNEQISLKLENKLKKSDNDNVNIDTKKETIVEPIRDTSTDRSEKKSKIVEPVVSIPIAFELPLPVKESSEVISAKSDSSLSVSDLSTSAEIRKIERLLESIEERFLLGEINESSYKDLKLKYQRQLQSKKAKS